MKIVIDIPDEEVPNKQDILTVDLHFIDGTVCECTYPFEMQKPCEDCISRQAVLAQTYLWSKDEFLRVTNPFDYLRKRINSLPPVTPQPKIGHWIIVDDCEKFIAKCSECSRIEDSRMISKYPYCHCGAKMEVKK